MFIKSIQKRNPLFIEGVLDLYQKGALEPDTYVVDFDTLLNNAKMILETAKEKDIRLYFMLKQLGRNPYIAKALVDLGYHGAVVVDYREAKVMMKHNIPLGNTGHLVQIPKHMVKEIVDYGSEVITVFSLDKVKEINEAAKSLNKVQDLLVKVSKDDDLFYSGQVSGIKLNDLESFTKEVQSLEHVQIVGATAFPCYLYDADANITKKTPNHDSVMQATEMLKSLGCEIKQINLPSTTSVSTLQQMEMIEGVTGEPGHGLTGTTPAHALQELDEVPAVLYLSEVSHQYGDKSYCYGGGLYRRSHVENALVEINGSLETTHVTPVDMDSIDYYFELDGLYPVSAPVIMAFRFQMFVTRSKVVLVKGIANKKPEIIGVYDGLGNQYE